MPVDFRFSTQYTAANCIFSVISSVTPGLQRSDYLLALSKGMLVCEPERRQSGVNRQERQITVGIVVQKFGLKMGHCFCRREMDLEMLRLNSACSYMYVTTTPV